MKSSQIGRLLIVLAIALLIFVLVGPPVVNYVLNRNAISSHHSPSGVFISSHSNTFTQSRFSLSMLRINGSLGSLVMMTLGLAILFLGRENSHSSNPE